MNRRCRCTVTELLISLVWHTGGTMTREPEIAQREKEGICILDLEGHLTIGASEQELRSTVSRLADGGTTRIVASFGGVDEMDADGLSALVYCHAHLLLRGGALKLLNLRQKHIELLILAKLASVFEIFTEEQDAVDSFFPDRQAGRYDILQFVEEQRSGREGAPALRPPNSVCHRRSRMRLQFRGSRCFEHCTRFGCFFIGAVNDQQKLIAFQREFIPENTIFRNANTV